MKTEELKARRRKLNIILIISGLVITVSFMMAIAFFMNNQKEPATQKSSQRPDNPVATSQQDYQRQVDISSLASQITNHLSNNRGNLPDKTQVFEMTSKLDLVTGTTDDVNPTTALATYTPGKDCEGNQSSRKFSVSILLNDGKIYCQ